MTNKLTPKQSAFVSEYLKDRNGTQAAIRAGYSEKTAQEQSSRLLSNVIVAEAVRKADVKAREKAEITRERLIEMHLEDRQLARENVQMSAAIKATEQIGKLLGLYVEKHEHKHGFLDNLDADAIAELSRLVTAERARRTGGGLESEGIAQSTGGVRTTH